MMANDWKSKYDYVGPFKEGLARVNVGGTYEASEEDEDLGRIGYGLGPEGGQWGFVDETGKIVIELKYDYVRNFSKGLAKVRLNRKRGFVDKEGNEVIELKYDWARNFSEGLAGVKLGDKMGYIDKTGKIVIELKYDYVDDFEKGLAVVKLGDKKGLVTREGKELLLTEDKHIQIKNLIELEKITEEDLINWINEQIVK
jgi:hypothetical protein